MKRVTTFCLESNLTEDVILLLWLANDVRRCLASSLTGSSRILFHTIGLLFIDMLEMEAEGNGEKFFFTLSSDSTFSCCGVTPKAPETCPPAWIVQPQYRNAELSEVGLFEFITRKQPNLCGFKKAMDPLWTWHNQYWC